MLGKQITINIQLLCHFSSTQLRENNLGIPHKYPFWNLGKKKGDRDRGGGVAADAKSNKGLESLEKNRVGDLCGLHSGVQHFAVHHHHHPLSLLIVVVVWMMGIGGGRVVSIVIKYNFICFRKIILGSRQIRNHHRDTSDGARNSQRRS
jgi:hypothetical protein